jgi:ankyrin repeat protein
MLQLSRLVALCVTFGAIASAAERPAVIEAARNGDRAALRTLIEKKANLNQPDADGATALHWAAYRDDLESVDLLVTAGANVNAANDLGATPLWNASTNGVAVAKRLLDAGANPNLALLAGETPLIAAARAGQAGVVELLLAKGANANARGPRGQTALMWAVSGRHPAVVKALLAYRADVHARSAEWKEMVAVPPHGLPQYNKIISQGGDTALLFAARVGDLESAKLLVGAGANVNDADAWGVSATAMAAHAGFTELVAWLLDRGADPDAAAAGFTALHAAIMRRDTRMVAALLARGADANAPLTAWTPTRRSSRDHNFAPELVGATPFWLASRFTQPDVMRLLLKHGANPLVVHHGNYHSEEPVAPRTQVTSAVMAAVGMGGGVAWVQPNRLEREKLMLESVTLAAAQGVDVNAVNSDGRTALDAARALKFESVVKFLTDRGARGR